MYDQNFIKLLTKKVKKSARHFDACVNPRVAFDARIFIRFFIMVKNEKGDERGKYFKRWF